MRASREALLNVEKHARANSVVLSLFRSDGGVGMALADDGTGEDRGSHGAKSGLGLAAAVQRDPQGWHRGNHGHGQTRRTHRAVAQYRHGAIYKKTIKGTLFGDANPTVDIPKLLRLYDNGQLKLDELITRAYSLDDVNAGYDDLQRGLNIRGIVDLAL